MITGTVNLLKLIKHVLDVKWSTVTHVDVLMNLQIGGRSHMTLLDYITNPVF